MSSEPTAPDPAGADTFATLDPTPQDLDRALHETFGFERFLPGQGEVVARVLRGEDLLVVRPTGSGKSLCYQLPALLLPPLTLVISPLISLMKDQVDAICARHPGAATFINSSIGVEEQKRRLQDAVDGRVRMLFVAPERFRYGGFLRRLQTARVQRFVVDEAHCITEWGHDFRPDYLFLRDVLPELGHPPLLALTATATITAQQDIARQLGRADMAHVVSGFNRPNLSFEVRYCVDEKMKWAHLASAVDELEGSGIVYASTRRETEDVAAWLAERTHRPVVAYHAGFEADQREAAQDAFMGSPDGIAVATTAFGMGIDKPDVRFVLHFSLPASLEAYYQQAGRAGRDGLPARCLLFYDPQDQARQEWFIDNEHLPSALLNDLLDALARGADFARLSDLAGGEPKLRQAFRHLETLGALLPGEGYDRWEIAQARLSPQTAADHDERMRLRRRVRESQLGAMVRYAEVDGSRRVFLLGYFGDEEQPTADEIAQDEAPPYPADSGVVTEAENDAARAILSTVDGVRHNVGRNKLVQVLCGSKAQGIDEPLTRLPGYGALRRAGRQPVREAVEHLVYTGHLRAVNGRLPVLDLTPLGRRALDDPDELVDLEPLRARSSRAAAPHEADDTLAPDDEALFERLRGWRAQQAREQKVPPYVIFGDQTLRAVACARPSKLEELPALPGIGPTKTERYGHDLIALVAEHEGAADEAPVAEAAEAAPAEGIVPLEGPWALGWQVAPEALRDVGDVIATLAATIDIAEVALAAPAGNGPWTARLLTAISSRTGLPVSFGLFGDDGPDPRRLATPLLLVGPAAALTAAAATLARAGHEPVYVLALDG